MAIARDDSRYIQVSAAMQPGNGELDETLLVGVAVQPNALAVARLTGDIPQNVNLAIKVDDALLPRSRGDRLPPTDAATGPRIPSPSAPNGPRPTADGC